MEKEKERVVGDLTMDEFFSLIDKSFIKAIENGAFDEVLIDAQRRLVDKETPTIYNIVRSDTNELCASIDLVAGNIIEKDGFKVITDLDKEIPVIVKK